MIEINEVDFEAKVSESAVPVLVDFFSPHCGPCLRLKPVMISLIRELGNTAKVVAVDVLANERLADEFKIAAVPTLIVFRGGREVHRMIGLKTKEYLREALAA